MCRVLLALPPAAFAGCGGGLFGATAQVPLVVEPGRSYRGEVWQTMNSGCAARLVG